MSIFDSVFNSCQVFINTFKHNILFLSIKNEFVEKNNKQYIQHSKTAEPCRSCTDFRTFSRMRRQEFSQTQVPNYFIFCILVELFIIKFQVVNSL